MAYYTDQRWRSVTSRSLPGFRDVYDATDNLVARGLTYELSVHLCDLHNEDLERRAVAGFAEGFKALTERLHYLPLPQAMRKIAEHFEAELPKLADRCVAEALDRRLAAQRYLDGGSGI